MCWCLTILIRTIGVQDGSGDEDINGKDFTVKMEDNDEVKTWLISTVCLPEYYELFMETGYETLDIIKEIENRWYIKRTCNKDLAEIQNLKQNIGSNIEVINGNVNEGVIDTKISDKSME